MKKTFLLPVIILLLAIMMIIAGCGKEENINNDSNPNPTEPPTNPQTTASTEIDGIKYTVDSAELKDIKGDCTADGSPSENGEYFSYYGDIYKVSDYKNLVITYTIENTTDKAFGYMQNSGTFKLTDGYELPRSGDISDLNLYQVASHSSKQLVIEFPVESSLKIDKIIWEYPHMDYDTGYWDDFGKLWGGEMTNQQFENKYKDKIEFLEFTVNIK